MSRLLGVGLLGRLADVTALLNSPRRCDGRVQRSGTTNVLAAASSLASQVVRSLSSNKKSMPMSAQQEAVRVGQVEQSEAEK